MRLLVALLLAVLLVVPSVEASMCTDQVDLTASQENSSPANQGKDRVPAHGHCHHGGVFQAPIPLTVDDVATVAGPLVVAATRNLPSERRDGLIRPPREC